MKFFRQHSSSPPYVLRPPYPGGRAALLSKPRPSGAAGDASVWGVVVDLGLPDYLLSVFAFSDETVAIYGSGGIHSVGLRGAPPVLAAAHELLADTAAILGEFSPIDDVAAEPLPTLGVVRAIARTPSGDLAAAGRLPTPRGSLWRLVATSLAMAELAHQAVVDGYEPADPGDYLYDVTPDYRSIRRTLLDWIPKPAPSEAGGLVGGVAVEFGEAGAVSSVFAFDDGSVAVYRSDGSVAEELNELPAAIDLGRSLRGSVEAAIGELRPAFEFPMPQPGLVQFMARTHETQHEGTRRLRAVVPTTELVETDHRLREAFERATELLELGRSAAGGRGSRHPSAR